MGKIKQEKNKNKNKNKRKEKEIRKTKRGKWRKNGRADKVSEERDRKEKSRKRNLSLRSMEIGSWVFGEVRGKVGPYNEGYTWVPKSWSFVKLHEVENFRTWNISSLKTI